MVYAGNNEKKGDDKDKPTAKEIINKLENIQNKLADTEKDKKSGDVKDKITEKKNSVKDEVYKENKNKSADVITLKKLFKELHRDKVKRREILKQLVDLRRQNNDNSIPLFVNGNIVESDVPPVVKEGRTLIPLRAVSNSLGAKVDWNQDTSTVTITKVDIVVILKLGSKVATVNGKEITIDVPADLISNRTMVPIRFIAETLKSNVDWDEDTGSVIIDKDQEDNANPEATPTPTPTLVPSQEVTTTPTPTVVPSPEETTTPTPTVAPSPEETATPTPTVAPSQEETATPTPTVAPSQEETTTPTPTVVPAQ